MFLFNFKLFGLLTACLSLLATALPVHNASKVANEHLIARTETPGGLFGDNNIPDLADLDQTSLPDCGLISVLGALVSLNPAWIYALISYDGDARSTTSATFKLYSPDTLESSYQTVEKSSLTNVRSDAHEGWWVGGVEQAIRQTGRGVSMLPSDALTMLTGRPSTSYSTATRSNSPSNALSKERAWAFIKANAERTPVIFQSWADATMLQRNHAFWIRSTLENGTRWIYLWNPYGNDEVYDFDALWMDCYALRSFSPPLAEV